MALALGVPGAPPQNLTMGGFCIRFRSDAELQCATESEVYTSLGFTVQETYAQAAALDDWVDEHMAVATLKPGDCVHALLQQLLLPSVSLAPFVTSTRFLPPPSSISHSVLGTAAVLVRPPPSRMPQPPINRLSSTLLPRLKLNQTRRRCPRFFALSLRLGTVWRWRVGQLAAGLSRRELTWRTSGAFDLVRCASAANTRAGCCSSA